MFMMYACKPNKLEATSLLVKVKEVIYLTLFIAIFDDHIEKWYLVGQVTFLQS